MAPTDVGTLLFSDGLSGRYFDARQYIDLDGDGVKEIRNGIPASINGSRSGLLAAELVDVDNDGYLDLVAGMRTSGTTFATTVFWGDYPAPDQRAGLC